MKAPNYAPPATRTQEGQVQPDQSWVDQEQRKDPDQEHVAREPVDLDAHLEQERGDQDPWEHEDQEDWGWREREEEGRDGVEDGDIRWLRVTTDDHRRRGP